MKRSMLEDSNVAWVWRYPQLAVYFPLYEDGQYPSPFVLGLRNLVPAVGATLAQWVVFGRSHRSHARL